MMAAVTPGTATPTRSTSPSRVTPTTRATTTSTCLLTTRRTTMTARSSRRSGPSTSGPRWRCLYCPEQSADEPRGLPLRVSGRTHQASARLPASRHPHVLATRQGPSRPQRTGTCDGEGAVPELHPGLAAHDPQEVLGGHRSLQAGGAVPQGELADP